MSGLHKRFFLLSVRATILTTFQFSHKILSVAFIKKTYSVELNLSGSWICNFHKIWSNTATWFNNSLPIPLILMKTSSNRHTHKHKQAHEHTTPTHTKQEVMAASGSSEAKGHSSYRCTSFFTAWLRWISAISGASVVLSWI